MDRPLLKVHGLRFCSSIPLVMMILLAHRIAPAADTQPALISWVNVTGNVGGEKWGYAGVTTMAAVPDSDTVIAGVSEARAVGQQR